MKVHSVATRISECSACGMPLPLCEALVPEIARVWVCSRCGTGFSGVLAPNYSIDELRGVRPEPVIFDPDSVRPVDPEMRAFALRLGERNSNNVEKRTSTRHPIIAILTAIEFDDQLRATGHPFQTLSRNLSAGGICLINDRAIQSDFMVIELRDKDSAPIQTLGRVLRQRPFGPYHAIGTKFVTKLAIATAAKMLR